tara:strand:+ start:56 stop:421 length:366 start_codon:yes stop_codon:yes gene_type:complete
MLIKSIRFLLGYLIVGCNYIFPPNQIKRSEQQQHKNNQDTKTLSLYQFYLCPFCVKVRRMIHRLNINIEFKDAKNNPNDRELLLKKGGKIKVPCLRIQEDDKDTWLYESSAINAYLQKRFL